jgi:hypothetical protein
MERCSLKFLRHSAGAFCALVVDPNEFHAFEFPVHSRVVSPEFAGTHDGDANPIRLSRRRAHSLLIPFETSFGSGTATGGKA